MGMQVIKAPNGKFGIFSSFTDTIVLAEATREEVVSYLVRRATRNATESTNRLMDDVERDPRSAYFQFVMTWDEALESHKAHGGEPLSEFREFDVEAGA